MHLKNGIVYNITVTEDKGFLSRRTRFVFFVYRLAPDAKPDRGMM